jgi:hypothetical protein
MTPLLKNVPTVMVSALSEPACTLGATPSTAIPCGPDNHFGIKIWTVKISWDTRAKL